MRTPTEPLDTDAMQEGSEAGSDPASEGAEHGDGQDTANAAEPPAPTLQEARATLDTWSTRRQELETEIADRTAKADAIGASIASLRRDAILGKAELAAAAPLVAERALRQAEINEIGELLLIAQTEEARAEAVFLQTSAASHAATLYEQEAALVERAVASDARIDAALAAFFEALDERWLLDREGHNLLTRVEAFNNDNPEEWPKVSSLRGIYSVPLVWERIEHANFAQHPRQSPYVVQL
jgi:hypothetical protein